MFDLEVQNHSVSFVCRIIGILGDRASSDSHLRKSENNLMDFPDDGTPIIHSGQSNETPFATFSYNIP